MNLPERLTSLLTDFRARLSSPSARGLVATSIWQLSNYAIPLLTFPYLARVLGVEGFGLIGLAVAIIGYALMITDWSFGYTATQAVAQNKKSPKTISQIIWDVTFAKAALGAICSLAVIVCAQVVPESLRCVLMAALLNILGAVLSVDWVLRGMGQFARFATTSVLGRLAAIPMIYLLVQGPDDAAMAVIVSAMGGLLSVLLGWAALVKLEVAGRMALRPSAIWKFLADGRHVFSSVAATSFYTNSIAVALGYVSSAHQVGLYAGADRIKRPVHSLLSPISLVFFPRMSDISQSDPPKAVQLAKRLLVVQGGLALMLSILLTLAAPLLVRILLGPAFGEVVPILMVQAWLIFFIGLSNVTAAMIMIPFGMKRELTYCIYTGAILGLALVFPLSYYGGAFGASLAALIAEIGVTVSSFILLMRRFSWLKFWIKTP